MFAKCFEILHQTERVQVQSAFSMKHISRSCTNLFVSFWKPDLQPEVVRDKIPADFKVYQIKPAGQSLDLVGKSPRRELEYFHTSSQARI